jgi:hypothetical protein
MALHLALEDRSLEFIVGAALALSVSRNPQECDEARQAEVRLGEARERAAN